MSLVVTVPDIQAGWSSLISFSVINSYTPLVGMELKSPQKIRLGCWRQTQTISMFFNVIEELHEEFLVCV